MNQKDHSIYLTWGFALGTVVANVTAQPILGEAPVNHWLLLLAVSSSLFAFFYELWMLKDEKLEIKDDALTQMREVVKPPIDKHGR